MTRFGPHETTLPELFADGAVPAMAEAGVGPAEVDSFYLGNTLGGMTENETHLAPRMASHIGLGGVPCQRFEDACATSSNAFKHAVQAVEAGIHDVVLVGGIERVTPRPGSKRPS
jgi:acetyl-CoA C-acetyltransferase/acetyl-CoA acyltransferase